MLISVLLLITIISLATGCTSTKDTIALDTNKDNMEILTGKVDV
ncbi:hypothetical protein [Clostridium sp. ZS2-4]|nr:hypothetical protein [Clostridium sp. ZS2-4]MCY6355314.1 hypothetical protein [Clostridium sp. ZS2-4]